MLISYFGTASTIFLHYNSNQDTFFSLYYFDTPDNQQNQRLPVTGYIWKGNNMLLNTKNSSFKRKFVLAALINCFLFTILFASNKEAIKQQIIKLVDKGCVLLNDENGKSLIAYNAEEMLVPASIIKILTAYIATDILGKDFSFKTEFYKDNNNNLLIKGWGDPFLISEEIEIIAAKLKQKGLTDVKQIFLDHSSFVPDITIPGVAKTSNPYDAINGALVVNFNTINIKKDASGKIISAEEQTPITPLAKRRGKAIKPGSKQRINLTDNKEDCLQYVGELFSAFLTKSGIKVESGDFPQIKVSDRWKLFYSHRNSRNLSTVIKGLMKYSNNFIANQIFLTIGAKESGYPANLDNAKTFFEQYINTKMNIPSKELLMYEGSGISRSNKVTGNVMIHIMEKFRGHANLLSSKKGIPLKSGTLTGVHNYAGYIKTSKGLRPFVIILNQKRFTRDKILGLLDEYCKE